MSSCSVDLTTEDPSEHNLCTILPTESLAQLNLSVDPRSPHGEEVTNQIEPHMEWNMDNLRCGESELSLQAELVRECVSENSNALFCDGVHNFRSTLPSWNKTQENESSTRESGDSDSTSISINHNSCVRKLGEDQSPVEQGFYEKENPMHFSSSDINPYVHQWQSDEWSRSNGKQYAFGSASDVASVQSNRNTYCNVMRCSSVDYGLNVQNSPFNSHLSSYANTRSISGTSSSGGDFHGEDCSPESTETGYPNSNNLNESSSQVSCDLSIATSLIKPHPVSSTKLENATLQVDEIVLLYTSQDKSSGKSTSEGTLKFTCDQETQTSDRIRHRKLPKHHRSFTETPAQMPVEQGTWASLQHLSINLSQLLHNTSELLGSICSNPDQNWDPSEKRKTDSCTQTAVDVAIQTEMLDYEIDNENQENQATTRKDKQRSPEVNVIVKVIGSDVNVSQEKTDITLTLQERQQNNSAKMTSMPDLNAHHGSFNSSRCSPSSSKDGNSFRASTPSLIDSQKLSLNSSPKYSPSSPAVSPIGLPSQPPIHSDHSHNTSVSCFGSHFTKMETSYPGLCWDTRIESPVQDPAVNAKLAILVDRASSPIQTFEAGAGNHRSRSKSFIGLQDRGTQIMQPSGDCQRKQRPASWYGFHKEQKEVNLTHLKSNDVVEHEQEENGAMLFVHANELSKFKLRTLSREAKLKSEARCQDRSNSSFVRSKATKSPKHFLKMPMVTNKPKYEWQCDVGNRERDAIQWVAQHGYAQMETESQLMFQEVEKPFTGNIDERKHVFCSASQAARQNTPQTLSEISAGTTSKSRRTFHRSASLSASTMFAQFGPLSENNPFGTESNEQKNTTLENFARNDSTCCNSGANCSPFMEIEMAMDSAPEDAQSIVLSECNTEVLLNENPSLICCSKSQVSGEATCRGPEDLPLHNKFCNWSGVFHSPPSMGSITSVTTSSDQTQTKDYVAHSASSKSKHCEERLKEIEKLRTERAQIMSGLHLNLNQHHLSVELTEAKLYYGLGETDTLLKLLQIGTADDLNTPIKQQLYDRHMKSIETFRKEREEKLQKFRRTRSLSPQKHLILCHPKECPQQELPSKRRDYLQKLRKDIVKNTRALPLIKSVVETPSEIEYLLRDYQKAREETKAEIARARDRLRERAEKEKCRLQNQISELLKEEERRKNMISRSSLCTGSNLSLSSNPTSGYSSSNTVSPDISSKELNKMNPAPCQMVSRGRKASRNSQLYSAQSLSSINIEAFLGTTKDHSVSAQPLNGSSPTASLGCLKYYQDLATRTTASFKAEIVVASINDLGNLLNGKAAAGWKYHSTEKGILMFYKKYASATKHGFMGVGVIEKPLHCVWCMVKDHSKRRLYDETIKTVQVHKQLGGGIQLVYLVNDTSVCYLNQPRDFCCISVETKEEQQYILAMQSIHEESMPWPVNDIVRGEILPSGWILQPDVQNGKEITKVIYMIQVDLGAPALPSRMLALVAKRQPLCIATLASFLSC
uniref:START domain-containing protein n=1 Tax=Callorhinchus milii TaxID=7868 RepID=A0A4W3KEB9_CALMI